MDLDTFMITAFCWIGDILKTLGPQRSWRQRGPQPTPTDAEVLTMEVVGEFIGLSQDQALFRYFVRHYDHFFPGLVGLHRTTFVRQAANLWKVKEQVWQRLLALVQHDPTFSLVDSFPLPVCQFARAYRCRRFKVDLAIDTRILPAAAISADD